MLQYGFLLGTGEKKYPDGLTAIRRVARVKDAKRRLPPQAPLDAHAATWAILPSTFFVNKFVGWCR